MTEPSIIERVAKAICDSSDQYCFWREAMDESVCAGCLNQARAAIAAMQEPTRTMLAAGAVGSGVDSTTVAFGSWECMIDAALKETTPLT